MFFDHCILSLKSCLGPSILVEWLIAPAIWPAVDREGVIKSQFSNICLLNGISDSYGGEPNSWQVGL